MIYLSNHQALGAVNDSAGEIIEPGTSERLSDGGRIEGRRSFGALACPPPHVTERRQPRNGAR